MAVSGNSEKTCLQTSFLLAGSPGSNGLCFCVILFFTAQAPGTFLTLSRADSTSPLLQVQQEVPELLQSLGHILTIFNPSECIDNNVSIAWHDSGVRYWFLSVSLLYMSVITLPSSIVHSARSKRNEYFLYNHILL